MKNFFLFTLLIGTSLISCKNSDKEESKQEIDDHTKIENTKEVETTESETSSFDITKIPLSNSDIKEIPFFNLPDGYTYSHKENRDYGAIRFWTGNDFIIPEGSLFFGRISTDSNKQFSVLEVSKKLDKDFTEAGAVQVFSGKVPREAIDKNEELNPITDYGLKTGAYGFQGFAKTWTYVIRQASQHIWIQLNESDDAASLHVAILKTQP